jgi:hypothetical protein
MMGQRIWAGTAQLCVLSLGTFAGVFFERHHAVPQSPDSTAAQLHDTAMSELDELLGLDDEQIEQFHAVLAGRQELVQNAWEQVRPQVTAAMRDIHTDIGELLRPDQRRLYHEWLNRQREEDDGDRVMIIPR